jgi:hypothetical protein
MSNMHVQDDELIEITNRRRNGAVGHSVRGIEESADLLLEK